MGDERKTQKSKILNPKIWIVVAILLLAAGQDFIWVGLILLCVYLWWHNRDKDTNMPFGALIVLLIGITGAAMDLSAKKYASAILDLILLIVLYGSIKLLANANAKAMHVNDDVVEQVKLRNDLIAALRQQKYEAEDWEKLIPEENKAFQEWADKKYGLPEMRSFVNEHHVMPALYAQLPAELKDVDPRAYEKAQFDKILAYIAEAKEKFSAIAESDAYKAPTMSVKLTNQEFLDLLNDKNVLQVQDKLNDKNVWHVLGKTEKMNMNETLNAFVSHRMPSFMSYFENVFAYATNIGYYRNQDQLDAKISWPWSKEFGAQVFELDNARYELKDRYDQVTAGAEGEKIIASIAEMISKVDASATVFCGATLLAPGEKVAAENDIILICSKGVFTVEVKNWNGDFIIGDDGIVDSETGEAKSENPIAQSKRHANALRKILKGIVQPSDVHPSVFMVNEHCTVEAPTATIPVYVYNTQRTSKLMSDIAKLPVCMDVEKRKNAAAAIENAKTSERRYAYNFPNFVRLAYQAQYMQDVYSYAQEAQPFYYLHALYLLRNKDPNALIVWQGFCQVKDDPGMQMEHAYVAWSIEPFVTYFDKMAKLAIVCPPQDSQVKDAESEGANI